MNSRFATLVLATVVLTAAQAGPYPAEPLKLSKTIPIPGLHDGDFDQFAVDLDGHRLFLAAEKNSAIEVFDLRTDRLIRTLTNVKEPHSMVYSGASKRLFVVDGGAAAVRVYRGGSYKYFGIVKLRDDCHSSAYDSGTKYMYVVNGGKGAHMPYSVISVIDTVSRKKLADIRIDSDDVNTLVLENSGPRLFASITGSDSVGVIDREKRVVIANWPLGQEGKHNVGMAFDEVDRRLFIASRYPAKLIILDSDSGGIVASFPCVEVAGSIAYDARDRRIYISGTEFVDVFQQKDPNHYEFLGRSPTGFRAKTAILVPELNHYYLAVPHHGDREAEVRVYEVEP